MLRFMPKLIHISAAAAITLLGALPALADDTEIFRSQADATGALPNVLFVIDTSGSMDEDEEVTPIPYDPSKTYSGSCNASKVYQTSSGEGPDCSGSNALDSFPSSNVVLVCKAALTALSTAGTWSGKAAQLRISGGVKQWRTISASNDTDPIECAADHGVNGQTDGSLNKYASRSAASGWQASTPSNTDNPWSGTNSPSSYSFYLGNWINWSETEGLTTMTRMQIVKNVTKQLADSLDNVNVGLMRYSSGNQGGMVTQAIANIATNKAAIQSTVDSYSADGYTPLSETYYEAARYFKGMSVDYGQNSTPSKSVAASRVDPTNTNASNPYKSPVQYSCQKNYIVYLTDGLPTQDENANSKVATMIGKSCDAPDAPSSSGWTAGSGRCADDLAEYLRNTDISPLQGMQNVQTYTIGFGTSVASGTAFLDTMAAAGGTEYSRTAVDVPSLTVTLQDIFSDIQQTSATFVTPSVSVNAFNRTQVQRDLYFNVFKAALGLHWPGNLKKYQLAANDPTKIVDSKGDQAVGPTGFFNEGTTSIWSAGVDGGNVEKGGAASRLKDPASRPLYTNASLLAGILTSTTGSFVQPLKIVSTLNLSLTDKVVGAGTSFLTCGALCVKAILYARGQDVDDENNNNSTTDARLAMGDPLHGKPAVVTYGGTSGTRDENDTVVFMPTNDGVLHAINGRSTGTGAGEELWAFLPKELLHRLTALYQNSDTANRSYGLDGDIQVLRLDRNQNGIIESADNDRVWLFFGMRMGEDESGKSYYYGLDVTNRNDPKILWTVGPDQLPGLGQTWSTPSIARVSVGASGADNDDTLKYVLIFGGGYDMAAENPSNTTETKGNAIFMIDAYTGKRLWNAGKTGNSGNLLLSKMTNAIPGRVTVIDLDGDQFADRIYAGDLGGRIWRFDIFNGNTASTLVTGGAIAQFGFGNVSGATAADNRRFYNAPDVAFIQRRSAASFFNIAIGSGYRGHPLDLAVTDRFYSLRDTQPFARWNQAAYNSYSTILDSQMTDITADPSNTSVPINSPGWKFSMTGNGAGEKILAEATTANNTILFTSFQPLVAGTGDPCFPANLNRAYALSVGGRPSLDFNNDGVIDNRDISSEVPQSGILGDVTFSVQRKPPDKDNDLDNDGIKNDVDTDIDGDGIPNDSDPDDDNDGVPDDKDENDFDGGSSLTTCRAGTQFLSKCPSASDAVRTFWQRDVG